MGKGKEEYLVVDRNYDQTPDPLSKKGAVDFITGYDEVSNLIVYKVTEVKVNLSVTLEDKA